MKLLLVFSLLATQAAFSSDKIFCGAWTRDQKTLEFNTLAGKVMNIKERADNNKITLEYFIIGSALDGAILSFDRMKNIDGTLSVPATMSVSLRTKENKTMDPEIEAVAIFPKYEDGDKVSLMANGRINGKHVQISCYNSDFVEKEKQVTEDKINDSDRDLSKESDIQVEKSSPKASQR